MMTSAAAIIAALGGNSRTGMCRCPAHDDKTPSLHVSDGRKGVVFFCHAGCLQEAVMDALQRRGLLPTRRNRVRLPSVEDAGVTDTEQTAKELLAAAEESDERPTDYLRGRGIKHSSPALKLLDKATMRTITGTMLPTMIARVTGKDGRSIAAHVTYLTGNASKNAVGANGKKRRMYGPVGGGSVVLKPAAPDRPYILGEGVETVLSAMQITGFPGAAALSAGNLAKLRPPKAASYIIAADNDAAGREAAATLAERLRCEGRTVHIAMPPSEGDDWNDVLQNEDAEECWQAALDADKKRKLARPVSALDERKFMELDFPERELLLEPWLPRHGLAMIYAPRGEGKTWFALAVGKAIGRGDDLLGWQCPSRARVLYVEGELPGQSVQARLKKFRPSPRGRFHILCRDSYLLRREAMPDLGDYEGRLELDRIIDQCRPDVIILDTLSTLVRSGVENDAESWAPIQAWLLDHRCKGRTIIVMHHSGKSGQQRGTSKREDVMDTIIKLKKEPEACTETESVFDLTFEKSRDFYGKDAEQLRLRFSTEDGWATWRSEPLRDVQADRVRELMRAGVKQKDIARELKVSPGRISQIVKEIRERGENDAASSPVPKKRVREKEKV